MNRTPKSWKRDTTWKYGNRPDPLYVDEHEHGPVRHSHEHTGLHSHTDRWVYPAPGERPNSALGWALVALVVIGVVFLIVRDVLA